MSSFGRKVLGATGRLVQVGADDDFEAAPIGTTVDWSLVTGAPAPLTLPDDQPIIAGQKYFRFGQVLCRVDATGFYGPYDPTATDGRQNLNRGTTRIVNETWLETAGAFIPGATDFPPCIEGGRMWKARILATTGAASLAAGPTFATLEVALPRMQYVD